MPRTRRSVKRCSISTSFRSRRSRREWAHRKSPPCRTDNKSNSRKEITMLRKLVIISLAVAFATSSSVFAATYKVDPAHSNIEFTIRHLVSKVTGKFKDFEGTLDWDAKS